MIRLQESAAGASFAVRVHPRAKQDAVTGEVDGVVKISLTAPALEGRANEACVEFLAEILKVARSSITIASGWRSRIKVIRVSGLSGEEVRRRLQVD